MYEDNHEILNWRKFKLNIFGRFFNRTIELMERHIIYGVCIKNFYCSSIMYILKICVNKDVSNVGTFF